MARKLLKFTLGLLALFLAACSSTPKPDSAARPEAPKEAPQSISLSNKKLLEIIVEQNRLFELAEQRKGKMSNSDIMSQGKRIYSLWDEYMASNPNDIDAMIIYAKFKRATSDVQGAAELFHQVNRINPDIAVVKQQLAAYNGECGQYDEAYKYMQEAVKLEPDNPTYQINLAQLIMIFREQMIQDGTFTQEQLDDQMINAYRRAYELDSSAEAKWRYARAFYDVKKADWETALKLWDEILPLCSIELEKQIALANKARVLVELGRDSDAKKILERVNNPQLLIAKNILLGEITPKDESEPKDKTTPEQKKEELPRALKKDFSY